MPKNAKQSFLTILIIMVLFAVFAFKLEVYASEGINIYYLRYDTKSLNNKIIDDNLLMIPAKNDFRAENFSQFSTSGVISAATGKSRVSVEQQIKENSMKTILMKHGLKSVNSKDYETVVSYEGVIITPLNIIKNSYHEAQDRYFYEVQIEFSPIAFPDKWEMLGLKNKFKRIFSDFFQLFK